MRLLLILTLLTSATMLSSPARADEKKETAPAAKGPFKEKVRPLLKRYCFSCHGDEKPKGDLSLTAFADDSSAKKKPEVWEKVFKKIEADEMPPRGRRPPPRPTTTEVELIKKWIFTEVLPLDPNKPEPGRLALRRLNRAEYNNTIRDLVGVSFQPADDFPADDVGYGFDNIGDVLSLPTMLMEKYLNAAEKVVDLAFQSSEIRNRIMFCRPGEKDKKECASKIIERFAGRAYRRPATSEEVNRLLRLVDLAEKNGDNFEGGIRLALQAVLASPHFLFKVELDSQPRKPGEVYPINDYALASRLSYFLWSSMPDDELFGLASSGKLRDSLETQVRRMLQDKKALALVENFAGQWLQIRNLKTATPDPSLFPDFDDSLRKAMQRETELLFETVMKEDRSILDLLRADFTFVNERLARHYGIAGIHGDEFRRISLNGDRVGIMSHASILTVTSNPTRTSPVKRGKFILDNILNAPPNPPPPDAGELKEDKESKEAGSLRKRMELHRRKADCAVCHQRMDPLGFALENFDAIGKWRTQDGQFPIDSSGELPDGDKFAGPAGLRDVLLKKSDSFRRCFVEKLLTFALGRGLEYYDRYTVDRLSEAVVRSGDKFSAVVVEIVKSDPFQMRRASRRGADAISRE